jgi:hypothetical protein
MNDDLDWDEFLAYVRDGRVVPVVGNDLIEIEVDGSSQTLESVLAHDLAAELGIELPAETAPRIAEVAFRYLQGRGSVKRLYPKLKVVLDRRRFEPPLVLKQLAAIREFPLVLTTSCTPLVRMALEAVRGAGRSETDVLAFTPYSKPGDLKLTAPISSCVYHLFGQASSMPDYVITEEDLIEFLHGLQSDRRPQNLFDYLRGRHLLFLGCGYTNWLARFFIRTLRNERFASGNPQKTEFVVDDTAQCDADLAVFLRHYDSQVFRSFRATAFVAEFYRRYSEMQGGPPDDGGQAAHVRSMPADAVFLSYAREDLARVRPVATALERAGIDVWLDERELVGGVDWEATIHDNIRRCSLFVPFISQNTEAVAESYFHVEWRLALRRAMRMAPRRPFIVPIAVDATSSEAPNVPAEFRQWQWMSLDGPGGVDAITALLRQNIRAIRAPQYANQ